MNAFPKVLCSLAILLLLSPLNLVRAETGTQETRSYRDPFVRVNAAVQKQQASETKVEDGALEDIDFSIRGIVLAGSRSMVNVGGKILNIGEVVSGHTLVYVRENEADFRRNGVMTTLVLENERSREDMR